MKGDRRLLAVGAGLILAYAAGLFREPDPDFDATFGIEAYRALGADAFALAGLSLAALAFDGVAAAAGGALSRVRGRAGFAAFLLVQGALYLALTDTSLSGDGAGIVYSVARGSVTPSNPLNSFLHLGLVGAGLEPREALRLLSCLAGVAYSGLAVLVARECFADAANRTAATALLVTCGAACLFFGSIELYAPVVAGLLAYLWLGLRWLAGKDRFPWPPFALGVLVGLHGAALALGPTLVLLFLRGPRSSFGRAVPWAAAFLAPLAAVFAGLYWGAWDGALPDAGPDRYGNFLGSMGQTLFLPVSLTPTNLTYRYALLDAEHLVGVANLMLVAAPVGLALIVAGRRRDARATFVAAAAGLLFTVPLLLNVTYALRRDWDLFVWIGVPLSLLGALRYLDAPGSWARAVRVAALGLLAFVPVVASHAGDDAQRRDYAAELARVYAAVGDEAAAARWRKRAEDLDPEGVLRRIVEVKELWEKGDPVGAEEGVRELLRIEPGKSWTHVAHAELLLARSEVAAARAELETAIRLAPESQRQRARRLLARIHREAGEDEQAIRQLERALREEAFVPIEAAAALRELAALRRARGEAALADALERLVERRETTGSKGVE